MYAPEVDSTCMAADHYEREIGSTFLRQLLQYSFLPSGLGEIASQLSSPRPNQLVRA